MTPQRYPSVPFGIGRQQSTLQVYKLIQEIPSVRIQSQTQYNTGLFILDLNRAPWGCG